MVAALPTERNTLSSSSIKYLLMTLLLPLAVATRADSGLPQAEFVLIDKSERKLWLITQGIKYREYDISLGDSPYGHKEQEGDDSPAMLTKFPDETLA